MLLMRSFTLLSLQFNLCQNDGVLLTVVQITALLVGLRSRLQAILPSYSNHTRQIGGGQAQPALL